LDNITYLVHTTFDGDVTGRSCCQGYRKTHAFIATQMPLPNTQVDFWRMVDDFDVVAIVMINPLISGDEVSLLLGLASVDK